MNDNMKLMKIKYMVVGIVIGVLATAALTAGASTVYEKFTAVARPDYTLVVDGQKVTLKTPPKTIDGATHLPLREMATILGKDVKFSSGTIELNSKDSAITNAVNYEFGKLYTVGSTQLKLNSVSYKENTRHDFPTNTLLAVNFDVNINTDFVNIWREFDFFSHVKESNKKIGIGVVEESVTINPGDMVTLEILIPVSDNKIVDSVVLKDPISNETIEYKINKAAH